MQEKETEYTKRIQSYSKSTIAKIILLMTSETQFHRIREIVIASETEQEVNEKLDALQTEK